MGHLVDSTDAVRAIRHHGDMENISIRPPPLPFLTMELFPPFFFADRFDSGLDACISLAVAKEIDPLNMRQLKIAGQIEKNH